MNQSIRRTRASRTTMIVASLAALSLLAAACGGDDGDTAITTVSPTATDAPEETTAPEETDPPEETTAPEETDPPEENELAFLDRNGDGEIRIGVAVPGPRDDGAYYQATVDQVEELSATYGFADPIIIDRIPAENAAAELANLVDQGVDIMIVAAGEIGDPLPDLIAANPDLLWYCNCGAGFPETPGLAQSQDDGSEISFSAGYATGLLLQDSEGDNVAFIGCCDVNFEKEAYLAFELGLQEVDESFTLTYVPTGNFPFDFDNTAGATEAFNAALAAGTDAVYPYLGGAHEPVVRLANDAGIIVMTAGSASGCARTDLDYDLEVRFDAGEYLASFFQRILAGEPADGTKVFRVGVDPEPGARFCDATAEQEAALEAVHERIASGEFTDQFGAIKGQAYAGG